MLRRLITLTIWILVGWTATSLLLRLLPQPMQAPVGAQALAPEAPPQPDWARLFGVAPTDGVPTEAPPPPESSRFQLLGVVAPREAGLQRRQGVALLAIDGGPAKSYRVGQVVEGELTLLAVETRGVSLGRAGGASFQLQLPPLPVAAVGSLPPTLSMIGTAPLAPTNPPPTAMHHSTPGPTPTPTPTPPPLPTRSIPLPSGVDYPALHPGSQGTSTAPSADLTHSAPATEDTGPRRRRPLDSR